MKNFELRFACRTADGSSAAPLTRTIATHDADWAHRIGIAMQEEPIEPDRWIARLEQVTQTEQPTDMGTTLHGTTATWGRVLSMLKIPFDAVKWIYTWDIGLKFIRQGYVVTSVAQHHEPEICGFRLWPPEDPDATTG